MTRRGPRREEKGHFCETVRETRGSERRMPWLRRPWSVGADEGEVLVACGDALNVAEAGVFEHRHQLVDHARAARVAEDRKQMAEGTAGAEGGVAVRGEVQRQEAAAGLEDTPY